MAIIACPQCGKSIFDNQSSCQFCGATLTPTQRPVSTDPHSEDYVTGSGASRKTIWTVYYVLAGLWIFNGLMLMVDTIVIQPAQHEEPFEFGLFTAFWLVIAIIEIIVGLGLFAKMDAIRKIVNFISGIGIFVALYRLVVSIMLIAVLGPFALFFVINNIISLVIFGATIWVIGETETKFNYH